MREKVLEQAEDFLLETSGRTAVLAAALKEVKHAAEEGTWNDFHTRALRYAAQELEAVSEDMLDKMEELMTGRVPGEAAGHE